MSYRNAISSFLLMSPSLSPSSALSASESLAKCVIVRCHIFTEMRGKVPPAVLISCNAFLSSALITMGDHVMLPAISFVSCLKSLSLYHRPFRVSFQFSLWNMPMHALTDTWLAWLSQVLGLLFISDVCWIWNNILFMVYYALYVI